MKPEDRPGPHRVALAAKNEGTGAIESPPMEDLLIRSHAKLGHDILRVIGHDLYMQHGTGTLEHSPAVRGKMPDVKSLASLPVALRQGVQGLDARHVADPGVGHVDDDGLGL